jgi:NAD(P)H-dependent flavin oxidoreductase YrpB (nitropropane dioxygenase family)
VGVGLDVGRDDDLAGQVDPPRAARAEVGCDGRDPRPADRDVPRQELAARQQDLGTGEDEVGLGLAVGDRDEAPRLRRVDRELVPQSPDLIMISSSTLGKGRTELPYLETRITELLGIEHPVIQDGMGPFNTVKLAAAVSNAGGIGSVSMPTLVGDPADGARELTAHIEQAAALTDKPFAVNVGVGIEKATGKPLAVSAAMVDATVAAATQNDAVGGNLKLLITSGGFPGAFIDRVRDAGLVHIHKVGSTRQAEKVAAAGVSAVIASGFEMGGHTHMSPVHTFVLVPNVTEVLDIPVILSGGARDGRTLAAALALGADAIAMGTRFIVTEENDWHPAYKQRILEAKEGEDTLFPAWFSQARGLKGPGIDRLLAGVESGDLEGEELQDWKNEALTMAQRDGDIENGIVAAGQVSSAIKDEVAISDFVPGICRDAAEILSSLQSDLTVRP